MPDTFVVNTTTARSVTASPAHQITLYNAGGGTLYYKTTSDVSSSSNDGNVASGASTTFTDGTKWLIAGTVGAKVFITYSQTQDTDAATQAELNTEISTRETKDAERVVGPAEATDLRVAIFDGTTGKKVKDGGTLLSALAPKTELTTHAEDTTSVHGVSNTANLVVKTELTTEKERAETAEATKVAKETTAAAATTDVAVTKVTEDAQNRWVLNADGKLEWGGGAEAVDTNLYRRAANIVHTDDSFSAVGSIQTGQGQGEAITFSEGFIFASGVNAAQNLYLDAKGAATVLIGTRDVATGGVIVSGAGDKLAFYGESPATQPEVKKAALTADELAAKLATLGLVKIEA